MDARRFYAVLGVSTTATQAEIKRAYRAEALLCHPDKVTEAQREGATQRFQLISEAFSIVGDAAKRREYDLGGHGNVASPAAHSRQHHEAAGDFFDRRGSGKKTSHPFGDGGASKFYTDSKYFRKNAADREESSDESWEPPANYSGYSNNRNKTAHKRRPPQPVEQPAAVLENRSGNVVAVVTWTRVAGADTYELWMQSPTIGDDGWHKCYSGPKAKVVVNGLVEGNTYHFAVDACNQYGRAERSPHVPVLFPISIPTPKPFAQPPSASSTPTTPSVPKESAPLPSKSAPTPTVPAPPVQSEPAAVPRQSPRVVRPPSPTTSTASPPPSNLPSFVNEDSKVSRLVDMGFAPDTARRALLMNGWDETLALNSLLASAAESAPAAESTSTRRAKKKKKKKRRPHPEQAQVHDMASAEREPTAAEVPDPAEFVVDDQVVTAEEDEMPPSPSADARVKCSRCKETVLFRNVVQHECDEAFLKHLLHFSEVVGDRDLAKLREFMRKASGELQTAVNLYYESASQ